MWFVAALGFKGILRIIELLVSHPSLPVHSIQFSVCSWAVLVGEDIKRRQPAIFLFTSALLWQSWLETLTGSLTLLASCRGGEVVSVSVGKVLGHLRLSTTAEPCRKVLGWKQNKKTKGKRKYVYWHEAWVSFEIEKQELALTWIIIHVLFLVFSLADSGWSSEIFQAKLTSEDTNLGASYHQPGPPLSYCSFEDVFGISSYGFFTLPLRHCTYQ